jgi:hypothetical protein
LKKTIVAFLLAASATSVMALQSGFVPCIEEAGRLHCFEGEFTPLWNSLCPRCWIDQGAPVVVSPSAANAFDSCARCHPGSTKKVIALWQTKYHQKHADRSVPCSACHKV